MELFYDRVSKMFTLVAREEVIFLGPITHSVQKLKQYGFTCNQAREAVLQAVFNGGAPVNMHTIERIAGSKFYVRAMERAANT